MVLELEMCWRWARDGVGALLEFKAGVESWDLIRNEMELELEAELVGDVGLVLEVRWCWSWDGAEDRLVMEVGRCSS